MNPENVTDALPQAAKQLADFGVRITSVAGPTDDTTMAACAEAGVPIIRICVSVGEGLLSMGMKRVGGGSLSGLRFVLVPMPWAGDAAVEDATFSQRAILMLAHV